GPNLGLRPVRDTVIATVLFSEIALKERNAATTGCNKQAHHKAMTGTAIRFPTLMPNIGLIRHEEPHAAAPKLRTDDTTFKSVQHRSINRVKPCQVPPH